VSFRPEKPSIPVFKSIDSYDKHTTIEKMHSITGQKFKPSSDQKISSISTKRADHSHDIHPSQSTSEITGQ
jgi:hypothetical protein